MSGRRVTRKDAEYVAAKIAVIHGVPFAFRESYGLRINGVAAESFWFFDYAACYGGGEIRELRKGDSGEWQPLGSQRRTNKEFFEWGNAYIKGALAFAPPDVRARLSEFFENNPVTD